MFLATLTDVGRAAMAKALMEQGLTFAWGSGEDNWSDLDFEKSLRSEQTLVTELGRRLPNQVGFVIPDEAGEIALPVGRKTDGSVDEARYRLVSEETPYLYLRVNFDFADASAATIREVGVFVGARPKETCPPGQRYFKADELETSGLLLSVQRLDPTIVRSPAVRQSFEFVLQI